MVACGHPLAGADHIAVLLTPSVVACCACSSSLSSSHAFSRVCVTRHLLRDTTPQALLASSPDDPQIGPEMLDTWARGFYGEMVRFFLVIDTYTRTLAQGT